MLVLDIGIGANTAIFSIVPEKRLRAWKLHAL
jgi:hypothetical protein